MSKYLAFHGGRRAIEIIRKHGFVQDIVKVVAGAAGGPKWLILGELDRVLFSHWFRKRNKPLFLVGSSAGAWRFAAASQSNPGRAMEKLRRGYIDQWYAAAPTDREIHAECMKIPDRNDFKTFRARNRERIDMWNRACGISRVLGEELLELMESKNVVDLIEPIHAGS